MQEAGKEETHQKQQEKKKEGKKLKGIPAFKDLNFRVFPLAEKERAEGRVKRRSDRRERGKEKVREGARG